MSTRKSKSNLKDQDVSIVKKRSEKSWILLAKDSLLESSTPVSIITLSHPGSGLPARYCLDRDHKKVYEVAVFDEPHRSWFIGETVKSDGRIHMTTLVNPTFLVLPKLMKECTSRAVPLEDLLVGDGFNKLLHFIHSLDHVADLKGPADMKAYKYNEQKTLNWLESRVKRVAKTLRSKKIHVTSGAAATTFVTSSVNDDNVDEEFFLKYAYGLVSQYLPEPLILALDKHFNFKPDLVETLSKKRKSDFVENEDKNKVLKTEPNENSKENVISTSTEFGGLTKPKTTPAVLSTKEKARLKAASNTRTISSFFTKKN